MIKLDRGYRRVSWICTDCGTEGTLLGDLAEQSTDEHVRADHLRRCATRIARKRFGLAT